ncbi:NAD(P)/FAD-dependent oxidoreductase [Ilumatobacter sp.]|uniref:NAD(P)/FAD-dependent oxidoreductase n=1 Tax=Ilumatobacter sp. TaxID=1967498 RepID=UPI003AF8C7C4
MRVVVVGAGIVGASTAFHLADADARPDVIVVDRSHPGKATLAGAGIICPWPTATTDEELVRLYVAGAHAIPEIVDRLAELGADSSYRRIGAIALAADDTELAAIEGRIAARSATSPIVGDVQRVDGSEARRRFPPLRRDLAGIWIEGGARLDGRAMAATLLAAAHIDPRPGDVRLVVEGDRARGVVVDGERIDADAVVVAAGAWADALLAPHGVTVGVEPQKGQILHLDVGDRLDWPPTDEWPSILPPGPHYLVPFDGGRVVVGATRETGSGFDTRVTVAGQREVLEAALLWAPGLADTALIETRVGLRPLASTGRPMIGPAPGVEGLLVGTGLGAAGLTIGPLAGRMLADQVLAT